MGRFTLRLPESLHSELENRATVEGVSLNQYIVYALTKQLSTLSSIHLIPQEMVDLQEARFNQVVAMLGEATEAEVDEFLQQREYVASDELSEIKGRVLREKSEEDDD